MVYIILGKGFEEMEAIVPCDMLRRAGVAVQLAGIGGTQICGSRGIRVTADLPVEEIDRSTMDMIVLPGGLGGVESILQSDSVLNAVRFAWENHRFVAAICAAPTVLSRLGITDGKRATCYPEMESQMGGAVMEQGHSAVRDGNLITGTAAGSAFDFALCLIEALKGANTAAEVARSVVYSAP